MNELYYQDLRRALRHQQAIPPEQLEACFQKLDVLYGIAELFRGIGKVAAGEIPHEWARPDLVDNWPAKFKLNAAVYLQQAAEACRTTVRQGVAPYVRPLQAAGLDFCLREIGPSGPTIMSPIDEVSQHIELPPLTSTPSPAPVLAVLAGLAEMVRNAARIVTDEAYWDDIVETYGMSHLDYQICVSEEEAKVCVTVWNPFYGQSPATSSSLDLLAKLYRQLEAMEISPKIDVVDNYPYALARQRYARVQCRWYPTKLRLARR